MPKAFALLLFSTLGAAPLAAQDVAPAARKPLADNSFLLEEAYNQEAGVVQHISSFVRTKDQKGWAYSFTQEWPVRGQRHQLSYSVPLAQTSDGVTTGLGDVMINYRLQVLQDEDRGLAISPRLSLSLPTGDYKRGLGVGGTGVQANLPMSKTIGTSLVSHTNAGATWFPKAPGAGDSSTSLRAVALGQSFIWLATPRFNVMLEATWGRTTAQFDGGTTSTESALVSPGIRWGYDFKSGLQVVPGIAFPIGVGPSRGTRQLFLYLSFEHPFTAHARPQ
ncbi:MAG TPA: transporter [Gemmatimonadaceae bacterium]|jgi:hypothetical protein